MSGLLVSTSVSMGYRLGVSINPKWIEEAEKLDNVYDQKLNFRQS